MLINPYVFGTAGAGGTTWNPADTGTSVILSNGNLTATGNNTGASGPYVTRATVGNATGKWYYEARIDVGTGTAAVIGIAAASVSLSSIMQSSVAGDFATYAIGANSIYKGNPQASTAAGAILATADIMGCAFDATTGKIWFAKNNTWILSGNPGAGTSPNWTIPTGITYFPAVNCRALVAVTARFASASFTYTPPTGFLPW